MIKKSTSTIEYSENIQISNVRISDRIYELITQEIIEGTIRYGDRLNIKEIAQRLQVSPMPVRDAIKRLEHEGIVVVKPQSTCYVRMPTQKSMIDAFELRYILEISSIEKIYPMVRLEDLKDMKYFLDRMEELVPSKYHPDTMKEYVKYDQLFHREICVLAGNEYLLRSYKYATLHLNISLTFNAGAEPDMQQVESDHRLLFKYLNQNSEQCVAVLRRHLNTCKRNMISGEVFKSLPT